MAVVLRLRREGSKDRPFYRIVAADQRFRRDGRFIEIVGTYNPARGADEATVQLEKVDRWLTNGAKPSPTVASLIKRARKRAPEVEAVAAE